VCAGIDVHQEMELARGVGGSVAAVGGWQLSCEDKGDVSAPDKYFPYNGDHLPGNLNSKDSLLLLQRAHSLVAQCMGGTKEGEGNKLPHRNVGVIKETARAIVERELIELVLSCLATVGHRETHNSGGRTGGVCGKEEDRDTELVRLALDVLHKTTAILLVALSSGEDVPLTCRAVLVCVCV